MGRLSLLAIVTATAAVAPALARADEPPGVADAAAEAKRLIDEANALGEAGDFLAAAARFRTAHALDPRPWLPCNVGIAFFNGGDLPRAHLYLGACMTRVGSLEAAFATTVRDIFARAEDTLRAGSFAPVDVTVLPATASFTVSAFEPDDVVVGARLVWLPFGAHTLTVRAEGHREATHAIEIAAPRKETVRVVLERAPIGGGRGDGAVDLIGPAAGQPARPSRRPPIVASAATGALAGGAAISYLLARSAASDAGEVGISADEYDRRVDSARFRQKLAWGLGGAAVVGAAASGWLWYRATRGPTVTVELDGGGATASVRGRF